MKPRAIVETWNQLRATGVDVLAPEAEASLAPLLAPIETLAEALNAIRALELVERTRTQPQSTATFVGTRPRAKAHEPGTRGKLRDLIASAQRELLVVGFSMTDAEVERLVHARAQRHVRVTLVGDREQEGVREWVQRWPAVLPAPVALTGVEPEEAQPYIVHGKAVVADRERALIGSANFTTQGLQRNVELGVVVEGLAAREVVEFIERLAQERWLIPVVP